MERMIAACVAALALTMMAPLLAAAAEPAALVRIVHTSRWRHPSPDPTGIAYLRSARHLVISDSEVDEIARLWSGRNLFVATRDGDLRRAGKVTSSSREPEDIAWDGRRRTLFVADDDRDAVLRSRPGPDGTIGTRDDRSSEIMDTEAFGSRDPEGLALGRKGRSFFVADAQRSRVFHVRRGGDRRFGTRDDIVKSFDTGSLGVDEPEGLAFRPSSRRLFIAGDPNEIVVTTPRGDAVMRIDISSADVLHPSAIALVPHAGRSVLRIYLADRGRDNRRYPRENDGRVFVFELAV